MGPIIIIIMSLVKLIQWKEGGVLLSEQKVTYYLHGNRELLEALRVPNIAVPAIRWNACLSTIDGWIQC